MTNHSVHDTLKVYWRIDGDYFPREKLRLNYLKKVIGLSSTLPDTDRYQLLHRTTAKGGVIVRRVAVEYCDT